MSEEEKKAIEQVNYIIEEVRENTKEETPTYIFDRDIKCLPILLNLIEKQPKEIEGLEERNDYQSEFIEAIENNKSMTKKQLAYVCACLELDNEELQEDLKNSVSKDKIKDKIEEIKEKTAMQGLLVDKEAICRADAKIQVLREILGED